MSVVTFWQRLLLVIVGFRRLPSVTPVATAAGERRVTWAKRTAASYGNRTTWECACDPYNSIYWLCLPGAAGTCLMVEATTRLSTSAVHTLADRRFRQREWRACTVHHYAPSQCITEPPLDSL